MRLARATNKISIWIKSEYVIYIGIASFPLWSGGLAPPKWRAGRLLCALTFHNASIAHFSFSRQSIFSSYLRFGQKELFSQQSHKILLPKPFSLSLSKSVQNPIFNSQTPYKHGIFQKNMSKFFSLQTFCSLHPVSGMFCVESQIQISHRHWSHECPGTYRSAYAFFHTTYAHAREGNI